MDFDCCSNGRWNLTVIGCQVLSELGFRLISFSLWFRTLCEMYRMLYEMRWWWFISASISIRRRCLNWIACYLVEFNRQQSTYMFSACEIDCADSCSHLRVPFSWLLFVCFYKWIFSAILLHSFDDLAALRTVWVEIECVGVMIVMSSSKYNLATK